MANPGIIKGQEQYKILEIVLWKVMKDEITYLLQSHLQFPHGC